MAIENLPPVMRPKPLTVRLSKQLGINSRRILDVGCYEGRNSLYLARQGHEVIGMSNELQDVQKAAAAAVEEGLDNCKFIAADPLDMPFASGTFSVATATELLHCMPREAAKDVVRNVQDMTKIHGLNAMSGYFIGDFDSPNENTWLRTNELLEMYDTPEWFIQDYQEDFPELQPFSNRVAVSSLAWIIAQRVH